MNVVFPSVRRLGLAVERGGGLVQDEDRRIVEDRPCERKALPLPPRQLHPAFPEDRVVPLGEGGDEHVGSRDLRRRLDLFPGGLRPPVGDVVGDGPAEEHRLLGHEADLPAERGTLHAPEVVAVDLDRAFGRVVEPRDQVDEAALPRPARPDDSDVLPRFHLERDPPEHPPVRLVRERHLTEPHVPAHGR